MKKILLTKKQFQWYKNWNKEFRNGIRYVSTKHFKRHGFKDWFYSGYRIVLRKQDKTIDLRNVGCGEDVGNSKIAFKKWNEYILSSA